VLIDAAVAAGVRRFLPSEFGNDTEQPAVRALPVFKPKVAVQEYLKGKAGTGSAGLTYTLVATGPFLDWGLQGGFLLGALKQREAEVFDGGKHLSSATTVATIGRGVAAVLRNLEATENRIVYIQDAAVTQNRLLHIAKELTPGDSWIVTQSSTLDLKAKADEKIARGIFDGQVAVWLIKYSLWNESFVSAFPKLDNELLGVETISDSELREIVKSAL
jgi:hypothetical protein